MRAMLNDIDSEADKTGIAWSRWEAKRTKKKVLGRGSKKRQKNMLWQARSCVRQQLLPFDSHALLWGAGMCGGTPSHRIGAFLGTMLLTGAVCREQIVAITAGIEDGQHLHTDPVVLMWMISCVLDDEVHEDAGHRSCWGWGLRWKC